MSENHLFERNVYLIGLVASVVYVAVFGYLATLEYVCSAVPGLSCPQSAFNILHIFIHSMFLGYLILLSKRVFQELRWKWYLLCAVVIVFLMSILLQNFFDTNALLIYCGSAFALFVFCILFFERKIEGRAQQRKTIKIIKIVLAACVLSALFVFLRIAGQA